MTLLDLMASKGRMTFAEFMDLALYHPEHGFYSNHVPGSDRQFQTSPSLSPWFGRLLTRLFIRMKKEISTDSFTVIEVGAGSGQLAQAALTETSFRWVIIEQFKNVEKRQRDLLGEFPEVSWAASLEEIEPVIGCLVLNEVLDNARFNVLEVTDHGVSEVFVFCDGEQIFEELGPLSDPRLEPHASRARKHLQTGDRFEVSLGIDKFAEMTASVIERGFFLTFDYGDEEPELWTNRPGGSVVSYAGENLDVNVLREPGERDITAHVNFSHLAHALSSAGWHPDPVRTQRDLLLELGAAKEAEALRIEEQKASGAEALRLISQRSALTALYRTGALGDMKVLMARKEL